MDVCIIFTIEVEGECPNVEKTFFENIPLAGSIILSENVDDTENWAITINGYKLG